MRISFAKCARLTLAIVARRMRLRWVRFRLWLRASELATGLFVSLAPVAPAIACLVYYGTGPSSSVLWFASIYTLGFFLSSAIAWLKTSRLTPLEHFLSRRIVCLCRVRSREWRRAANVPALAHHFRGTPTAASNVPGEQAVPHAQPGASKENTVYYLRDPKRPSQVMGPLSIRDLIKTVQGKGILLGHEVSADQMHWSFVSDVIKRGRSEKKKSPSPSRPQPPPGQQASRKDAPSDPGKTLDDIVDHLGQQAKSKERPSDAKHASDTNPPGTSAAADDRPPLVVPGTGHAFRRGLRWFGAMAKLPVIGLRALVASCGPSVRSMLSAVRDSAGEFARLLSWRIEYLQIEEKPRTAKLALGIGLLLQICAFRHSALNENQPVLNDYCGLLVTPIFSAMHLVSAVWICKLYAGSVDWKAAPLRRRVSYTGLGMSCCALVELADSWARIQSDLFVLGTAALLYLYIECFQFMRFMASASRIPEEKRSVAVVLGSACLVGVTLASVLFLGTVGGLYAAMHPQHQPQAARTSR